MRETLIIGFSGRKQSGKGVMCKFIQANASVLFPGLKPGAVITYSFASHLKYICHEVLGLTYEQCYGSDDDKNTLTRLKWEDMPHYLYIQEEAKKKASKQLMAYLALEVHPLLRWYYRLNPPISFDWRLHVPCGPMTAREVLQEVGTGIFRRMFSDVWISSLFRQIARQKPAIALIDDIRFPNEGDAIFHYGGYLFHLLRCQQNDTHISETAMDGYKKFTGVIDNRGGFLRATCIELFGQLQDHGITPKDIMVKSLRLPDGQPIVTGCC